MSLRTRLIVAAYVDPELRPHIVPLLGRVAMEHATEEARKEYLKEHPKADPKNHTVKPSDGSKATKGKFENMLGSQMDRALEELPEKLQDIGKHYLSMYKSHLQGDQEKGQSRGNVLEILEANAEHFDSKKDYKAVREVVEWGLDAMEGTDKRRGNRTKEIDKGLDDAVESAPKPVRDIVKHYLSLYKSHLSGDNAKGQSAGNTLEILEANSDNFDSKKDYEAAHAAVEKGIDAMEKAHEEHS